MYLHSGPRCDECQCTRRLGRSTQVMSSADAAGTEKGRRLDRVGKYEEKHSWSKSQWRLCLTREHAPGRRGANKAW